MTTKALWRWLICKAGRRSAIEPPPWSAAALTAWIGLPEPLAREVVQALGFNPNAPPLCTFGEYFRAKQVLHGAVHAHTVVGTPRGVIVYKGVAASAPERAQ